MTAETMEQEHTEPTKGAADAAPGEEPEAIEQHAATAAELAGELAAVQAKADDYWDQLLRSRAELENLRRRQAAELEKAHKFALDSFVRDLLQVRDSLELGYAAAQDEAADVAKLREGTELTLKLLGDVMGRFGVAPVEAEGQPFNPDLHQAMTMESRADVPANTVTQVFQKGYTLNGRLVRPALVTVSRAA
jgi:molecular chaperone GrpE